MVLNFQSLNIVRKTVYVFVASFLLLGAVYCILLKDIKNITSITTTEVALSNKITEVKFSVKDVCHRIKEFVATGDDHDLTSYNHAIRQLDNSIDALRQMITDKDTRIYLDELEETIHKDFETIGIKTILIKKGLGSESARAFYDKSEASDFTLKAMDLTLKIEARENQLLKKRIEEANTKIFKVKSVIVLGGIVCVLVFFITLWLVFIDYQANQRMQSELVESERRIKHFLETIPMGVYVMGKGGKFHYGNRKFSKMMGVDSEVFNKDAVSKNFNLFISGTDIPYPIKRNPVLLALSGQKVDVEDIDVRYSDKPITIHAVAEPIYNDEEEVEYAIVVFEDITRRKQYERELDKTKEQLAETIKIAQIGHWELDLQARITVWSERMYELYDIPINIEGEVLYELALKRLRADNVRILEENIVQVKKDKRPYKVEYFIYLPDGSKRSVSGNVTPIIDSEGNVTRLRGTLQDITDRKNTEKELWKAKQLAEKSVKMKDIFLANMSHEIRTPLNAIIGFAELLDRRNLSSTEEDYVRAIRTSGESLLSVINDILDFSKIEAGMMAFEETPLRIEALFHSLQLMLGGKAKEKNIGLSFTCDNNVPQLLLGDSSRLTQILLNLVGNSIKFTLKGKVAIHARLMDQQNDISKIEFSVKDTGIGIAEDKLDLIFNRFSQAEADTTRKYGGTGLGLSITRSLVELQGGQISVISKKGEGAEFVFTIPFKISEGSYLQKKNSKGIDYSLGKLKVLLVDDNELNIKLGLAVLSGFGIKADTASNGLEAVEKVKETTYSLVLMDIQMPEMDGFEATNTIRNKLNNNVPIVAMTANALAGEREKCISKGMDDYLSKPFKINELLAIVNRLAKSGDYNDEQDENEYTSENDSVVDVAHLYALTQNDKKIAGDLMELFIKQMPIYLGEMDTYVKMKEFNNIKKMAHKMKASVSIMGSKKMVEVLTEMENDQAENSNIDFNQKLQETGLQAVEVIKSEWAKLLNERKRESLESLVA